MTELAKRIISSSIILSIFSLSVFSSISWGLPLFICLMIAFILLTFFEFMKIIQRGEFSRMNFPFLLISLLLLMSIESSFSSFTLPNEGVLVALVGLFFWVLFILLSTPEEEREKGFSVFSYNILGIALIVLPLSLMFSLSRLDVFLLIVVIKSTDIGGYIFGNLSNKFLNGTHKFTKISPKKSIEGLIGSLFFSYTFMYIFFKLGLLVPDQEGFLYFSGLFFTFFAVLGDLFESYIKRTYKVKDSSGLIPGMGGFFDVSDSLLFSLPLAVVFFF